MGGGLLLEIRLVIISPIEHLSGCLTLIKLLLLLQLGGKRKQPDLLPISGGKFIAIIIIT
jgi:hypothetical protein